MNAKLSLTSRSLATVVMQTLFLLALLTAVSKAQTTTYVTFDPTSAGVSGKGIAQWTYDVKAAGQSCDDIGNGVALAGGAQAFSSVRVAWYPSYALVNTGGILTLDPSAESALDYEVTLANCVSPSIPYFLSPKTETINSYYVKSNGTIDPALWVNAIQLSRNYYQNNYGKTIAANGICNEPDNTGGKFSTTKYLNAFSDLDSNWGSTIQEGPDTEEAGAGATWLPTIYPALQRASTHAINGGTTIADFRNFFNVAASYGLPVWLTEMHSMAEALVGGNKGTVERALWWNPITEARGDFIKFSQNNRIFYQTAADNSFGATAAYLDNAPNSLYIFIANNNESSSETYTFTSPNTPVSYDGGTATEGPYTVTVPIKAGPDGEQVIHVTW